MEMDNGSSALLMSPTIRAYRSHKESERRRRQRINAHLATLRTLIPATMPRIDKATLLGEVVRHVRELRGLASDMAVVVPAEGDEVRIEEEGGRLKVRVCCNDRPGLMGDLGRAIRSVRARMVRAEFVTIGGRVRSEVDVEVRNGESLSELQAVVRLVLAQEGPGSVEENYKSMMLY